MSKVIHCLTSEAYHFYFSDTYSALSRLYYSLQATWYQLEILSLTSNKESTGNIWKKIPIDYKTKTIYHQTQNEEFILYITPNQTSYSPLPFECNKLNQLKLNKNRYTNKLKQDYELCQVLHFTSIVNYRHHLPTLILTLLNQLRTL